MPHSKPLQKVLDDELVGLHVVHAQDLQMRERLLRRHDQRVGPGQPWRRRQKVHQPRPHQRRGQQGDVGGRPVGLALVHHHDPRDGGVAQNVRVLLRVQSLGRAEHGAQVVLREGAGGQHAADFDRADGRDLHPKCFAVLPHERFLHPLWAHQQHGLPHGLHRGCLSLPRALEGEGELGAHVPLALERQLRTHGVAQVLRNHQPQAGPLLVHLLVCQVHLPKFLHNALALGLGNANAGVGHREMHRELLSDLLHPDLQRDNAGVGELDGVRKQIEQHLAEAGLVPDNGDVGGEHVPHVQFL
mmetsp:Transcript_26536/g.42073  ORF Transcript_26536/g.42073 Transcript_26536/m.42073 type:complete len:301 (-) Transcript_26536:89-991(-)